MFLNIVCSKLTAYWSPDPVSRRHSLDSFTDCGDDEQPVVWLLQSTFISDFFFFFFFWDLTGLLKVNEKARVGDGAAAACVLQAEIPSGETNENEALLWVGWHWAEIVRCSLMKDAHVSATAGCLFWQFSNNLRWQKNPHSAVIRFLNKMILNPSETSWTRENDSCEKGGARFNCSLVEPSKAPRVFSLNAGNQCEQLWIICAARHPGSDVIFKCYYLAGSA